MPVIVKAAIWNVMTEVGDTATNPRDLKNFTSLLEWQDRLKLLRGVVELAHRAMPVPTTLPAGTTTLRLFLAPEYFFSETCNQHVVDYETRGHVVEGLKKISADYASLLLIPGTVTYFKPLVDKSLERKRLKADPTHDSRLVKYAGCYAPGQDKSTYLAHNTAYAFYNGQQVFKYRKMLDCAELNTRDKEVKKVVVFAKGDRVGLFDFDKAGPTVKIGMEICADHAGGQLSKHGASNLDLQIILAASTSMKTNYTVVKDGGCVFLCNAADENFANGTGRAWQKVAGTLVDLRAPGAAVAVAPERIDPLSRAELGALSSKTTKLDSNFTKAVVKNAGLPKGTDTSNPRVQRDVGRYLQTRGGTVHFYEATVP
jgi:predicted amidohydrolase